MLPHTHLSSPVVTHIPTPDLVDPCELLTVAEVASLLKVSRSWVYEHTRSRSAPRGERLPYIKIGKYLRFDPAAIRAYLTKKAHHG